MRRWARRVLLVAGSLVALAVLGGAGVYGVAYWQLDRGLAAARDELGAGGALRVGERVIQPLAGRAVLRDVRVRVGSVAAEEVGPAFEGAEITAAEIAATGLGWGLRAPDRLERLRLAEIRITRPDGRRLDAGSLTVTGLDVAAARAAASADAGPGALLRRPVAEAGTARDVAVTAPERAPITADRLALRDVERAAEGGLRAVTIAADGVTLPRLPAPVSGGLVTRLAPSPLSGDLALRVRLAPADQQLAVEDVRLAIPDAGELTGRVVLHAVDPAGWLSDPPRAWRRAPQEAALGALALTYRDDGLVRAAITAAAEAEGRAPAAVVADLRGLLAQALAEPTLSQVTAFLERPGTLSVEANPDSPMPLVVLGLQAMLDPEALARRLQLAVTAEPAGGDG